MSSSASSNPRELVAMEGSAEDVGAPDSWERTDLDESMSRLKLSSNNIKPMPIPHSEFSLPQSSQEPPESSSSSSSLVVAVPSANRYSEDVLNQVDQFLRVALQNPRERLSSICKDLILGLGSVEDNTPYSRCTPLF